jgi:hypothetical protein
MKNSAVGFLRKQTAGKEVCEYLLLCQNDLWLHCKKSVVNFFHWNMGMENRKGRRIKPVEISGNCIALRDNGS